MHHMLHMHVGSAMIALMFPSCLDFPQGLQFTQGLQLTELQLLCYMALWVE